MQTPIEQIRRRRKIALDSLENKLANLEAAIAAAVAEENAAVQAAAVAKMLALTPGRKSK